MAMLHRVNPSSRANPDTGFGAQPGRIGGRFVNKDGSFNLKKVGLPFYRRISAYSKLLELSSTTFVLFILLFYVSVNLLFTMLYLLAGTDQLQGFVHADGWGRMKEVFFFSTETFTTVGYGRVNPTGDMAHIISSLESMTGFLSFAVLTGLLYGRFSRPKAYIVYSENALISPYRTGTGLMFRMAPYKSNHHLTDARITVSIALIEIEDNSPSYKFYQLKLERDRIDAFNMNWTVVHPIDETSPLLGFSTGDFERFDVELYVQVSGFDPVFSNMVLSRTSYTYKEIVVGGKFEPMYHESEDGNTTILELHKLNDFKPVNLD